ncbi:hypothetical protein BUALT_Bualt13G0001900 [Buddleja alternifolia]|uniref:Uncharacterized protein n=1 Tax=Buddleja alternifolia TaxID=168488 RepID=A0AAV6WHJ8_9LAMI|nr:hypothetical protein BUALT_Bualt13G0001900 [Buddleja alternifolia]
MAQRVFLPLLTPFEFLDSSFGCRGRWRRVATVVLVHTALIMEIKIMASSLNGLTVGDNTLSENLMESPASIYPPNRSLFSRDELSLQYSPMSEDSDDSRYYESSTNTCSSQPESVPTSPVSPYRCQKPLSGFATSPPSTSYPSSPSQHRQRGSDTEGRFPSSPSDIS